MRITLGSPWVDADGVAHGRDETIDVDARTARRLLRDGTARPAGPEQEPEQERGDWIGGEADE